MTIPLRRSRNFLAAHLPRPPLSYKDEMLRLRIMQEATLLFAEFGRPHYSHTALAQALELSPARLRRFFADPDALLAAIIRRHLHAIADAIGDALQALPPEKPITPLERATAYYAATRTPGGTLCPAHLLLARDRHLLPDDERLPIETMREGLASILAHAGQPQILDLLDMPSLAPGQIAAVLTFCATQAEPIALPAPARRRPHSYFEDDTIAPDLHEALWVGDKETIKHPRPISPPHPAPPAQTPFPNPSLLPTTRSGTSPPRTPRTVPGRAPFPAASTASRAPCKTR